MQFNYLECIHKYHSLKITEIESFLPSLLINSASLSAQLTVLHTQQINQLAEVAHG